MPALLVALSVLAILAGWFGWGSYQFRAALRAIEQRHFQEAQEHLATRLKVWPGDEETLLLAAQTARRAGSYDAAQKYLQEYRRQRGEAQAIEMERTLARAQRGDLAGSEGCLQFCIAYPENPYTLLILEALAQGYIKTLDVPRARQCLELWLERQPGSADRMQALLWHAWAAERTSGEYHRAMQDYRQVLEMDPDNDEARLRLAQISIRAEPKEALEHFERVRNKTGNNMDILLGLAKCHRQLGQLEEARNLLDELLTEKPQDVPSLTERGILALDMRQPADAEIWLRKAQALTPDHYDVLSALSRCLEELGKQKEAQECRAKLKKLQAQFQSPANTLSDGRK